MKKIFALLLVLVLVLCGCGSETPATEPSATAAPTEAATEEPTEAPTEKPTEAPTEPKPAYINPVTGEALDAPMTNRLFGISIGNGADSGMHGGVSKADLLFETYVNGHTTRRFAMFSDLANVEAVGGVRSMRIPFTDLSMAYDAIAIHASGSNYVLGHLNKTDVPNIYAEQWGTDFGFRNPNKPEPYEHRLFIHGDKLVEYAESQGIDVTQEAEKDYGFQFTENAAPAGGVDANTVTVTFKLGGTAKDTVMTYDADLGRYVLSQYGHQTKDMVYDNAPETFKNVFVLLGKSHNENVYHIFEGLGSGEGFFACDGKMVPIQWHRDDAHEPFRYTLEDGTPLEIGIGSSYIALAPTGSAVTAE